MGAPDPNAIHDVFEEDGRWHVWFNHRAGPSRLWPFGPNVGGNERRNRVRRAQSIARQVAFDGWVCKFCGVEIGFHKRADARYCRERCKKAAARERPKNSGAMARVEMEKST